MPIIWSNHPAVRLFPYGRTEAYPYEFVKHVDIHGGYGEALTALVRLDDDPECYGWCYDSYFSEPLWRNANWRLEQGRFLVKVEVISAGARGVGLFRLVNDVPVNAFRLENAHPDDYRKIFH